MPPKRPRPPILALETRKPASNTVIEYPTPVDVPLANPLLVRPPSPISLSAASSSTSSPSSSPLLQPVHHLPADTDPTVDDLSRDLAALEQIRRNVRKNLRLRPIRSTSATHRPRNPSDSSDSPPDHLPDLPEHRPPSPQSAITPESAYFTPLTEFKATPLSAHPHLSDHLRRLSLDPSSRLAHPHPPPLQSSRKNSFSIGTSPALLFSRLSAPTRPLLIDTRPLPAYLASHLHPSVNMAIPSLILRRSKKASGSFSSLDAVRQYITTEDGKQTWDDWMIGDDWDGDIIIFDENMDDRDRSNPMATAWSLLHIVAPLLQHGTVDYLEGGLAAVRSHPYLSQFLIATPDPDGSDHTPLETTIMSAPPLGKKSAGLPQLNTLSASRPIDFPELERPPPSHILPAASATQSWHVIDDYATPSPPPSSTVFSRSQPPRRPSIPALRRLDTITTDRAANPPKLSVRPALTHAPSRPSTLAAPSGLRARSRSPSHLQLTFSNHSPPGSAKLLVTPADPTASELLPPPSPFFAQPSTPRTPGTPMPPSPMTARPDTDQPPTTEEPIPAFLASNILPNFLYLGPDIMAEEHVQQLLDLGVKRILNLAIECDDDHGLRLRERFERYVRIPMRDIVEEDNITRGVREACMMLDDARLHSAPTYVHCKAGRSRSVTAVMAYLIHANHWTLSRAYAFVVGRRKGICPNIGFVSELMTFEEQELGGKSVGVVKMTPTHESDPHDPDSSGINGNSSGTGNYQVAVGGRRPQHIRESLPPAFTREHSFHSVPSMVDAATLGDSQQEMEIKDAEGRYRHARRAPVNEATLQPTRRVSKAGLESQAYV